MRLIFIRLKPGLSSPPALCSYPPSYSLPTVGGALFLGANPACLRAFIENAEQCECSDSLPAWRLRMLGCILSSPWMCGIGDVAHSDGSVVWAGSVSSCLAINNREMQKKRGNIAHEYSTSLGSFAGVWGCVLPPVTADVSAVPYGLHTLCRYSWRVRCAARAYSKI